MRLVLVSPPTEKINGGIKQIFRLAEALRKQGYDAVIFEEKQRRPAWFSSTAPVIGLAELHPNPQEILILPEDYIPALRVFADWPQTKALYSQNHFYASFLHKDRPDFHTFNVTHALCCSRTNLAYMEKRHPALRSFLVPCGIDRGLFKPAAKTKTILYIPRKRPIEAAYLKDIFRHAFPVYDDWNWIEASEKTEEEIAKLMGEASVFLLLSRLESLGLTGLEAMASGCVVAGYTGSGGREFATAENGFWMNEDDFEEAIEQLRHAMDLALLPPEAESRRAYARASEETLAAYTVDGFEKAAKEAIESILKN